MTNVCFFFLIFQEPLSTIMKLIQFSHCKGKNIKRKTWFQVVCYWSVALFMLRKKKKKGNHFCFWSLLFSLLEWFSHIYVCWSLLTNVQWDNKRNKGTNRYSHDCVVINQNVTTMSRARNGLRRQHRRQLLVWQLSKD